MREQAFYSDATAQLARVQGRVVLREGRQFGERVHRGAQCQRDMATLHLAHGAALHAALAPAQAFVLPAHGVEGEALGASQLHLHLRH